MAVVQNFLLELGTGFAFVGREYRLEVGQTEQFLDMLFYNIQNQCYVVVEIKTRNFEPGDMGQLGTYVAAVDGILKRENENAALVAYGSSGGSIRKLNLILTKALMIGAQNNKQSIDADMVLSAVNDIELC